MIFYFFHIFFSLPIKIKKSITNSFYFRFSCTIKISKFIREHTAVNLCEDKKVQIQQVGGICGRTY